jgi:hypothetical protein
MLDSWVAIGADLSGADLRSVQAIRAIPHAAMSETSSNC